MSTKHTPAPWSSAKASIGSSQDKYTVSVLCGAPGQKVTPQTSTVIALVQGSTSHNAFENAEFIARACNSHYELLAACEAALRDSTDFDNDCLLSDATDELLAAAVAKAKGGDA